MNRWSKTVCCAALLSLCATWAGGIHVSAADWPQWRYDAGRTAASPEELPAEMHLQWVRHLPMPKPAWPKYPRLCFDSSYEPVVMGKVMFVPSMVTDSVSALDTDTGAELWKFYTDGPVRLAPVAFNDKVAFVSDDGYLYCLNASDGCLLWKYRHVPYGHKDRKVLGNDRLISLWPARGGPVLSDGKIYFASGVWPCEGVSVSAVEAETGRLVWGNDEIDLIRNGLLDHNRVFDGGLSPQGYLGLIGEKLFIPSGRAMAGILDPETGKLEEPYSSGWKAVGGRGCWYTSGTGMYFFQSGDLYNLATRSRLDVDPGNAPGGTDKLGDFREPVLTEHVIYFSRPVNKWRGYRQVAIAYDRIVACEVTFQEQVGRRTSHLVPTGLNELWAWPSGIKVHIKAGSRLYGCEDGIVAAVDIPDQGGSPGVSWETSIEGTPSSMLAGDGKLFIVTRQGSIYCFGAGRIVPKEYTFPEPQPIMPNSFSESLDTNLVFTSTGDESWSPIGLKYRPGDPDSARSGNIGDNEESVLETTVGVTDSETLSFWWSVSSESRCDWLEFYIDDVRRDRISGEVEWQQMTYTISEPGTHCLKWRYVKDYSVDEGDDAGWLDCVQFSGSTADDQWLPTAEDILQATDVNEGYCLVLGVRSGQLARELAQRSRLHVIAVDPNTAKINGLRKELDDAGLYGTQIVVHPGNPLSYPFPPYMASMIVSEDSTAAGIPSDANCLERIFRSLRPYGGVACLVIPADLQEVLAESIRTAELSGVQVDQADQFTLLERSNALPGSADWTHEDADAGNSLVSRDERVKPPFGVLWFGGAVDMLFPDEWSFNWGIPPGNGNPNSPRTPLVAGGRIFFQVFPNLNAIDVYTGRPLWTKPLPGVEQDTWIGHFFNYVASNDSVYVISASDGSCYRIDAADGSTLSLILPHKTGGGWREVCLWNGRLFGVTRNRKALLCMDSGTGEALWKHESTENLSALAVGSGSVFCIESTNENTTPKEALVAFDAQNGNTRWRVDIESDTPEREPQPRMEMKFYSVETKDNTQSLRLVYSEMNETLILVRYTGISRSSQGFTSLSAYDAKEGTLLWSNKSIASGYQPMLHRDRLITQLGTMYDPRTYAHLGSFRGGLSNRRGCGRMIAGEHLVAVRNGYALYIDLESNEQTYFRGVRSGCTNALIPANGVLNMPNFSHGCSCNYPLWTSLALVPVIDLQE